jgi:hypothetical protein
MTTRNAQLEPIKGLGDDELKKTRLIFNEWAGRFELQAQTYQNSSSTVGLASAYPVSRHPSVSSAGAVVLRSDPWSMPVAIIAIVFAIAVIAAHYAFLSQINGEDVSNYSQFWMPDINNAIAQGVVLTLKVAATYSLLHVCSKCISHRDKSLASRTHTDLEGPRGRISSNILD